MSYNIFQTRLSIEGKKVVISVQVRSNLKESCLLIFCFCLATREDGNQKLLSSRGDESAISALELHFSTKETSEMMLERPREEQKLEVIFDLDLIAISTSIEMRG